MTTQKSHITQKEFNTEMEEDYLEFLVDKQSAYIEALKSERDAIMKLAIRRREAMMTAEAERDHANAGWKNAMVERDELEKERDILLANLPALQDS